MTERLDVAARRGYGEGPWDIGPVIDLLPASASAADIEGRQLSGAEPQMLAIGRALLTNPGPVLMDEPSSGLAGDRRGGDRPDRGELITLVVDRTCG